MGKRFRILAEASEIGARPFQFAPTAETFDCEVPLHNGSTFQYVPVR